MLERYKKELEELTEKMQKAELFAERLPVFADTILDSKYSGEESWINMGNKYKDIYLAWGIRRGFYKKGTPRSITNMKEDYSGYYFSIYINTISLFDMHEKFGLYDSLSEVDVFFTDHLNTTFYVTDENIENFLETLQKWYLKAKKHAAKIRAEEAIQKAERELERLKENTRVIKD